MKNAEQYTKELLNYKENIYKELSIAQIRDINSQFNIPEKESLLSYFIDKPKLADSEYSCPFADPNRISIIFEFYLKNPRGDYPISIHSPGYKISLKEDGEIGIVETERVCNNGEKNAKRLAKETFKIFTRDRRTMFGESDTRGILNDLFLPLSHTMVLICLDRMNGIDNPIGCLILKTFPKEPKVLEISSIVVDKLYRGQKLGKQFFSMCERFAEEMEIEKIRASTWNEGLGTQAIMLYKHYGFKIERVGVDIEVENTNFIVKKDEMTEHYTIAYELTKENKKDIYPEVILEKSINNYNKNSLHKSALVQEY